MRRGFALLALVLVLGACETTGTSPRSTSAETFTWTAPRRYEFTLQSSCGERSLIGRFHVFVENGKSSAKALDESGRAFMRYDTGTGVPTLEELLDEAHRAREDGADVVEVRLDETDGHPESIEIDHDENAIDDEACYEVSHYSELKQVVDEETQDRIDIYAALIRQLITKDHRYRNGRSPFKIIYVVDGPVRKAGRPWTGLFDTPPRPFSSVLSDELRVAVPDLPTLQFVPDGESALRRSNRRAGEVKRNGVLVALGPIERKDGGRVHVFNVLWCGGKCARWSTYVLREVGGGWKITGTSGRFAIS